MERDANKTELRILLLEDDAADAELVEWELRKGKIACATRRVDTEDGFRRQLQEFKPDITLSDFSLPSFDGLLALAIARESCPDMPFVFVSGTIGEERAIDALKCGATDYVLKTNLARLAPAVTRALQEAHERAARKQAEEDLRAANERLLAVFEASPLAIYCRDREGFITAWNRAAERLYGWTESEVLGEHLPAQIREERVKSESLRRRVLQGEVITDLEVERHRRDGSKIHVSLSLAPLSDSAGEINGYMAIAADITSRKEAERRLACQHTVTSILAESATLGDAISRIVQAVCETLDWDYGAVWMLERGESLLRCIQTWHPAAPEFAELGRVGDQFNLTQGSGLVARVCDSGEPLWVEDVTQEGRFRRAAIAAELGLHSGFFFPFRLGVEVLGIIELFSREFRRPDPKLIQMFAAIGSQIAQFTERRHAEERLSHLANFDSLTGLANRNLFRDRLSLAMARAKRSERMLALMFVDLDRFKEINDTLGHTTGDLVLQGVAARFREFLRGVDTIARLGGDEFTIVLEDITSVDEIGTVAEKIQSALAAPFVVDGREVFVTASIGITIYPLDVEDAEVLLQYADIAMYHAKQQGRNNYQLYSADIDAQGPERLRMENELRRALERREFFVHYQPQVDMKSGRIVGAEALLRWKNQEFGTVPPARFIPLAEETGLIVPIGEWVLRTVCAQNKAWQDQGLPPVCIAVNLSARQFRQNNLIEMISRILSESGLDPRYLELEITESMMMHQVEDAIAMLERLSELGVRISIDDFGTGFSSLSYLKRFPVQKLKIDRSFVSDISTDLDDAAIVTAVVALARSLRLETVAEAVETREQIGFLEALGCDTYQGYYFSKPLPAEEFAALPARTRGMGSGTRHG